MRSVPPSFTLTPTPAPTPALAPTVQRPYTNITISPHRSPFPTKSQGKQRVGGSSCGGAGGKRVWFTVEDIGTIRPRGWFFQSFYSTIQHGSTTLTTLTTKREARNRNPPRTNHPTHPITPPPHYTTTAGVGRGQYEAFPQDLGAAPQLESAHDRGSLR